jgi:hypothetical protein
METEKQPGDNLKNDKLLNIDFFVLPPAKAKLITPVKSLALFEPNSNRVFKNDGLFSTLIFGPYGSQARLDRFSYIDLNGVTILHPLVYKMLISLKSSYEGILAGNVYAIFDNNIKDFVTSSSIEPGANTGYEFFMSKINEISFHRSESVQREEKIKIVETGRVENFRNKNWLVMPAGMRDYSVDNKGNPTEDEINKLYRKLMTSANLLENFKVTGSNISSIDGIRYNMQKNVLVIYEYIFNLLNGKNKFIQGKWIRRSTQFSQRNVFTPSKLTINNLIKDDIIDIGDTVVGLFQFLASIAPLAMHHLHAKIINRILSPDSPKANLVDSDNNIALVDVDVKKRDEWISLTGLANIINKLRYPHILNAPVKVGKYFMLLIYDDGKRIKLIYSNSDIESDMSKEHIRPITYAELFYLSIFELRHKIPLYTTRYPVIQIGSNYPGYMFVRTTFKDRSVIWMNGPNGSVEVPGYPIFGEDYVSAMSPHYANLEGLVADFDGDTGSGDPIMSKEGMEEVKKLLNQKTAVLSPTGGIQNSSNVQPARILFSYLTSDKPQ